jgi:hypothetical protein
MASKTGKVVFFSAMAICMFWILGSSFRVYDVPFMGAIFEVLWLPALIVTLLIPVISLVFLVKEKFSFRSLYLYSLFLVVATVVYLQYFR